MKNFIYNCQSTNAAGMGDNFEELCPFAKIKRLRTKN